MSNEGTVHIRAAHPTEAARLTDVAFAAKRHWGYEDQLIELWTDELTVAPEFAASHPVYCAERDGEIAGFYALCGEGKEYELEHMWVHPEHMAAGIGTLLLEHALKTVAALGGSALIVAADPNAEGFYRKMGAILVGRAPSRPTGRTLPLLKLVIESSRAASIQLAPRAASCSLRSRAAGERQESLGG